MFWNILVYPLSPQTPISNLSQLLASCNNIPIAGAVLNWGGKTNETDGGTGVVITPINTH
jgi:hypothetical protein